MARRPLVVIALDLGTNCGYAVLVDGKCAGSGTWRLWTSKDQYRKTPGWYRWSRLSEMLTRLLYKVCKDHNIRPNEIHLVVEDVYGHGVTTKKGKRVQAIRAAHVYGGLRAVVETAAGKRDVPVHGLGVNVWKAATCGDGNASKETYVKAANRRFRRRMNVKQHEDEAAALCIAAAYSESLETT